MGRMVRQKKEYTCSFCAKTYLKWQGFCQNCKRQGTLEEKVLVAAKPKQSLSARALGERAKRSERVVARETQEADGPDPNFRGIASSTGRVGHITSLQFDAVSRSYVIENKNRVMPTWLIKAWVQINQRAVDFNKEAYLHVDPPNMPKTFIINGKHLALSTLAIIGRTRHEQLLKRDRALSEIESLLLNESYLGTTKMVAEIQRILREM